MCTKRFHSILFISLWVIFAQTVVSPAFSSEEELIGGRPDLAGKTIPLGCLQLQNTNKLLQAIFPIKFDHGIEHVWGNSGNIYGWATEFSKDIDNLKNLTAKLGSDPLTTTRMKLVIKDREDKIVKALEIPWDPALHQRELFFRSLKLKEEVYFNPNTLNQLSPEVRDKTLWVREVSSYGEPRFIHEILHGKNPITQNSWYRLEHAEDRYQFLMGQKPMTSLYDFMGQSWNVDRDIVPKKNLEIHSVEHFEHRGIGVNWIKTGPGTLRSEDIDLALNALLLDLRYSREDVGKGLQKFHFAHTAHVENDSRSIDIHFLDLKYFNYNEAKMEAQWLNAPKDLQNYISGPYLNELGLSPATIGKLHEFTTENADRIQYLFLTKQAFSKGAPVYGEISSEARQYFSGSTFKQTGTMEHFDIQGSMGIVYSTDPVTQPLSMEKYAGIKLDRKPGEKCAELIRLGVDPSERDFGPKSVWKLAAYLANTEGASRVFAITEEGYAQKLIDDFGFKKVQVKKTNLRHDEWVLEVNPQEFFQNSVVKRRVKPKP